MRNTAKNAKAALSLAAVIASTSLMSSAFAADDGYKLITDRKKGNCVACHMIPSPDGSDNQAGNGGPPLIAMKARFPDRKALFDQIYDPTQKNPNSFMPPFGAFNIISDAEINTIMDYLYKH